MNAAGYACWIALPSYAGFAAGFVLWGAGSSLASGAFEAFAYDELAARGRTSEYASLLGRSKAASLILNLLATVLAAPLFELGGYVLAGAVSVTSCLIQSAVARSLPEAARVEPAAPFPVQTGVLRRYGTMLRSGLGEVATSSTVRKAVGLVALLSGFLAFDEYFPLLARDLGASTPLVPLLIAITVAAQAIGSALAGPAYRLVSPILAAALASTAVLIATGSLSGRAAGFLLIALGYGLMQLVLVVSEARLQATITGRARATITSASGLFADLFAITVYTGFALGSRWLTISLLVAALTVPVLLTAALLPTALPHTRVTPPPDQ